MRIVIPVSFHDQHQLHDLVTILLKFGGLERHHVTFFPQLSQTQIAKEQCARLMPVTGNASVIPMDRDLPINNVPQSPNAQWAFVARTIAGLPDQIPWLFMEIDAKPTKHGWADLLESAYNRSGKPFFGNIVATPYRTEQGAWYTIAQDEMMMGVGMYPAFMARWNEGPDIAGRIAELGVGATCAPWTWGVYLRQTMAVLGWAHTDLISDMNSTKNYREADGRLICDTAPSEPARRPRGGMVHSDAVLVHGCKDDSLTRILVPEVEKPVVAGLDPSFNSDQATLVIKEEPPVELNAPPVSLDEPSSPIPAEPDPHPTIIAKDLPESAIRTRITAKSTRVGDFAKEWNMTPREAKRIIEDAGFEVLVPSGWVKEK